MLTEKELIAKLEKGEDSFVERKSLNDDKDLIKTIIAFANSCPIGFPGIIFYGVKNNGELQVLAEEIQVFDNIQKKINARLKNVYPEVYILQQEISKDNKKCLAISIPGSDKRPHFSGPSYVR